ncbi:MAG: hypothetical protein QM699_02505 [Amaricoccus sp.]|uniref:hypothetical protein n=1 Tax=Amaricoccus sp. TaxID=1872485 RepID=UPI0039E38C13
MSTRIPTVDVAPPSVSAAKIFCCDDEGVISTATGFLYSLGVEEITNPSSKIPMHSIYGYNPNRSMTYLITNWHVVSGRHFLSKEYLNESRRIPIYLQVILQHDFPKEVLDFLIDITPGHEDRRCDIEEIYNSGKSLHGPFGVRCDIYNKERDAPLWLEHCKLNSKCDVVAIPFEVPSAASHRIAYANGSSPIENLLAGSPAFIVGFPHGLSAGHWLPIWKSGYVASEPNFDISIGTQPHIDFGEIGGINLPAFFIDSLTRGGMSGSPVFVANNNESTSSRRYHFVGAYSGRIEGRENEAALGICWKRNTIREIVSGNKLGNHPHVNFLPH